MNTNNGVVMDETMKVTRTKRTPQVRLEEIEAKIARAEAQLEKFYAARRELIAEVEAQVAALSAFVAGAKA